MLLSNLDVLATAPGGVARLRELILTLAVQGKLVPQDPADEPAGVLLQKIRAEKDRLMAEGKIKRDKPLAEIAEEEKPFGLPQGWEWASLATVGVINPRNDATDETLASFVQMSSIPVEFSAVHISEPRPWKDIKSGFTQFAEGDVGVAKITPCFENGKSTVFQNLSNGIGAGTTELHIVRPLGGIERRYVLLFLKTPAFLKEGEAVMTGSAGQKRLPRSYFECKPFPLPPLAEQSRIVTRVEELMRLCDALQAKGQLEAAQHAQLVNTLLGTLTASATPEELADNWQRVAQHFDLLLDRPQAIDALEQTLLQLAVRGLLVPQDPTDEPASALLQKIRAEKDRLIAAGQIKRDKPLPPITDEEKPFELPVGWEWVRLDAVFQVVTDGDHLPPPVATEGIAFLTIGNISAGRLNFNGCRLVPKDYFDALAEYRRPKEGDILYTVVGASYGRAVVVDSDRAFCVQRHIGILKPSMHMSLQYLSYLLSSHLIYAQATRSLTGTAQPTVGIRLLRNFLAPLPPLAEQSRIVTRVTALRRLCADLRQRLADAQTTQSHLAQALVESTASV
jgi:type I restriction enzyme, S subunit